MNAGTSVSPEVSNLKSSIVCWMRICSNLLVLWADAKPTGLPTRPIMRLSAVSKHGADVTRQHSVVPAPPADTSPPTNNVTQVFILFQPLLQIAPYCASQCLCVHDQQERLCHVSARIQHQK